LPGDRRARHLAALGEVETAFALLEQLDAEDASPHSSNHSGAVDLLTYGPVFQADC
jgi:hypothetical protein